MKQNKITSFLTALIIAFNLFPVCMVSAEETVSISTVNDFKTFVEKCVYDEYSKNKTFVLQNDIDLNGEEIQCAEVFCGVFEGGGHSIKNLKMSFEGSNKGLFAAVTKDAQIKDLNISGEIKVSAGTDAESILKQRAVSILNQTDIKTDDIDDSAKAAGGIAGYNEGKIINCSFSGKINGQKQVGGIAGYNSMNGVIDSCVNEASVTGGSEVGGLVGYNEGRIKLSQNKGAICPEPDENTTNAGGICGNNEGAVVICTNDGAVGDESFGDNVGGICGKQSGEIRECINNGNVRGRRSVGGICGRFEPYTDIDLSYESAKAAIQQQGEILKNDINSARTKILDYGLQLLTGTGDFSSLMSALGLAGTGSRLDNLMDAATNMMNSVTDAVNSASENNLSGSLKDTIEQANSSLQQGSEDLSSFTDETTEAVRDMSNSLESSLNALNDFLDEFDGKGEEISELIDNMNTTLDEGRDDAKDTKNKLSARLDELSDDIDNITDNLEATHNSLNRTLRTMNNTAGDLDDVIYDLDKIVTNLSTELKQLNKSIDSMKDTLENKVNDLSTMSPSLPSITIPTITPSRTIPPIFGETDSNETESGGYNVLPDGELESEYDVEPSVVGLIRDILFTTAYAEDDEKTAISDLKSTDISLPRLIGGENADTALIKYSINNGEVEGNELAGGIAGSTGFESVVRSGESITLPDGTKVDKDSVLKAVIDSCISSGSITSKTDYAGGICGKSDIGNIKNSLTTGEIETTEGGYAGGTAGYSGGEIENCIAINDVFGNDHIGGIAGSGRNIKSSYALPRLDGTKDKSGAIAGFITGDAENSYFIDEGLSGIDGANLEGKAEAVKPEDMTTSDGSFPEKMSGLSSDGYYMASGDLYLPQINALARNDAESVGALLQSKSAELSRFHFNVIFRDKDKEIKSMTVDYGTVLTDSDIPRLTADGEDIPMWDKDVHSPIVRHTTFTSVYNKATTTISSDEEPPLILVESIFDDGTTVSVSEETIDYEFDGYNKGKAYSFTLSKDAYDVIKVHIRDEKKKADKIGIQIDGKWIVTDCSMDKSYAVFETEKACSFVILYKRTSPVIPVVICAGAAAVLAAAFVVLRRVHKRYGAKKEENI